MNSKNNCSSSHSIGINNSRNSKSRPTFKVESVEPRVMLSATWIDATDGDDVFSGTILNDYADGLDGDDILSGGVGDDHLLGNLGDDILSGGLGNDILDGGDGFDTANFSDATESVYIDLSDGSATGQGSDTLIDIEGIIGSDNDDTIIVSSANNGDVLTIDGGDGNDTLDLSAYSDDDITDDGDTITVQLGAGESFTINHSNVETILTTPANQSPEAGDDIASTDEDIAITTDNVLANDTDLDGDTLNIENFTQAANGTVEYNNDGTFTYTPDANFNGMDSFTYTVTDGNGATDTATVTVNVNSVNDGPEANDDTATTDEDNAITTGNVLANDTDIDGDTLAVDSFTQAAHGTVTYNDNDTFTYTPDANYNGNDSFTYTVSDGNGGTETATVDVNIDAVNDGPETSDDIVSTDEDNAITTGNVLDNDTDIDGDTLAVDSFTQADNGTVEYNDNGTFIYTPDANFNGTDSFTYTVSDGNGATDTATVTVNVNSVNDGPVANDDTATTDEDNAITTDNVLADDTDLDGDTLAVDSFTQADNGTVEYNDDGTFTYTPDANFNGTDSFTYTVSDGNGATDTATVTVNVNSVNDGPVANGSTININEDAVTLTANLLLNDTDIDGDDLSVESFTQAAHGTVVHNGDGTFTYTPDANFNGTDSFTYTVSDGNGGSDTATINFNIAAVNDNPDTGTDSATTNEDTAVETDNVLANDFDVDGDDIRMNSYTQGAHGNVSYHGDGTFTYTPDANFNGTDSFTYTVIDEHGATDTATVSIAVNAVNDAPEAVTEELSGTEDTQLITGNLLANDIDIDGDNLELDSFTQANHGTIAYNGDGTFTYTPDANFNGQDSFTYTVSDGNGETSQTTVTLDISSVNDAPVSSDDSYTVKEDRSVITGTILANDSDVDGDGLLLDSFTQPEHGTISYHTDGTFTYTPDANYNGTDSFTYTVSDGNGGTDTATISFTVNPTNDAPVAEDDSISVAEDSSVTSGNVLDNDSDIDADTISIQSFTQATHGTVTSNGDGTFSYTPNADYNGNDSFTYTITDGNGESSTATINISVSAVNDDAIAVNDSYSTDEDGSVTTGNVLDNDIDIDGDGKMLNSYTQPSHGSVVYNSNGTFTYTPDANFNGSDSFTYTITDGNGNSSEATVDISVNAVNDAPDAANESASTDINTSVTTGNVLANDTDLEGDSLTITDYTQPGHGNIVYNGDGTFTYTPDADYDGMDHFTYTVSDGNGGTDIATVAIHVGEDANTAPDAVNDSLATDINTPISDNVMANDTDSDGDTLTIDSFTQAAHGTVVSNDDGTFTYTPDADFNGIDSFTYTISDGNGGTDTATVSVTVSTVNSAPNAVNDNYSTAEDTQLTTGNVLSNDTDADGDTLTLESFTQAANGTVTSNGDGTFTYTPDADFNGTDSFTYTINDGNGGSDTATISINVSGENDGSQTGDDSYTVDEDNTLITGNVLDNDVDAENDGIMFTDFSDPEHGTAIFNSDGTFTYIPDTNFNGTDSFTYTVTDGNGQSDTATVSITVNPVNDAPETGNDTIATQEDSFVTTDNPFLNDSDVDGDEISLHSFTQAANGTVAYNGDGSFTYIPDANYNGTDSFTYTVTDGNGETDTATVTIEISPVNDNPDANDEALIVDEDSEVTSVNVLDNDSDADGDGIRITSFTNPSNGSVTFNGDGTFTYRPARDFNGTDSFTYTISDGSGATDTATINIDVTPVNDAPMPEEDFFVTDEDTPVTTDNVLSNDLDVDIEELTISDYSQPANGTVSYNDDGTFTYTPDKNYNGDDNFTYTVRDAEGAEETATIYISVTPVNDAPVVGDDILNIDEDNTLHTGDLLANDTDVDGDGLIISSYTQPEHGTIVYNGSDDFTYIPDANYNGTDSFTYTVLDGHGGEDTATVTLNVTAVNDNPIGRYDLTSTYEDTPFTTGSVLANDTDVDGDTLSVESFVQPNHGTAVYNGDGTFTYTPDENYNGYDYIHYTVSDGNGGSGTSWIRVQVRAVNDAPVSSGEAFITDEDTPLTTENVLANDSDVDGDSLSVSNFTQGEHGSVSYNDDGTFTYTPDNNYFGTDSFTYTVSDGHGGTDTATINLTVNAVNDAPVLAVDIASTDEDTTVTTGNVLNNDYDIETDAFDLTDFTQPAHGSVTYNDDGTFTYTPDANYNGTDSFTYTVTDAQGGVSTQSMIVVVAPVNDAPVAFNDSAVTDEDTATTTVNVLANDTDIDGDTLSVETFTQAANGTVVYNNNGTFTYTPDADYNGTDSFTYTVTDSHGGSHTATVELTTNAVNDAPRMGANSITTAEDAAVTTANVLANDFDVEGDSFELTGFTQAANGTVSYNDNGTFTYTPDENFNGKDSFTYTVTDDQGGVATQTITVEVTPVNDGPVAADDVISTDEDNSVTTGNLLANDTDIDGDTLALDSFTQAANGTVIYNGNGLFTYVPDPDYNGTDSFTYTVTDNNGGTDTATVSITVNAVNDGPVAIDDAISTDEDNSVITGNVLANDTDTEGDTLSVDSYTQAANGIVSYNGDGTFSYIPNENYNGTDSFTYTVTDGKGGTDTATVTVNVNAVNDGPEAIDDIISTTEDTSVRTDNLLVNDIDIDGDTLSVENFTQAANGTVSYNDDGTFTYTPNDNFNGTDSFTYTITDGNGQNDTATVTVNVSAVNDGPVANDDLASTDEDNAVITGNALANDTDTENDTLSVESYTQAANGTVSYNDDGTFTYTPDENYNGTDSFTYTITDGNGSTDTATVNININAVNDGPAANDDTVITDEDNTVITANVLDNDSDIDGDIATIESFIQASNGTVSYNGDGTFTYIPDADYNGTDSFTYTITDGNGAADSATVSIEVCAVNDGPTANDDLAVMDENDILTTGNVIANDTDIDGNTLSVDSYTQAGHGTVSYNDDGTFTYTPDFEYSGQDSFTYTVTDGNGGTDTATVVITVVPLNRGPQASDDLISTDEDTSIITGNLLGNDTDPNDDVLSVDSFNQPSYGTVSYNGDGTFTYTPDENFNGSDSFTYTITDGHGEFDTATVEINVNAVNDGPVANDDAISTNEDMAVTTANVLDNDSDLDGDAIRVGSFTQASHGTITYNDDSTFTYTPDENFNGTDSFTYTVTDNKGGLDTATIAINVNSVNDEPVANDDAIGTTEDSAVITGNVLANDTDLDGDALSVENFTQAANGTVSYNDDGTFTYTPDANYNGTDNFTYTVTDSNGGTDTATVTVNVNSINDHIVANDDIVATDEDNAITTENVLANDTDLDDDAISVQNFTQAANGAVSYNEDGTFTYTPNENFNGTDSFTYTVTDGNGSTDTATVTVNVNSVNDGPVANNDAISTAEDSTVTTGNVLANDTDLDGDTLSVDSYTQAANGTVSYNNDGTFTYTPNENFNGTDSFTYSVTDGNVATDTATVTVNVNSVNDGPVANDDIVTTNEDNAATTGNVLANDTDLDGGTLRIENFTQAANGTVSYNNDGTFTYAPNENFNGTDSFTYTVTDGNGATDTATVTVYVNSINDGPVANNNIITTDEDNAVTTSNVLANDTDLDGDTLSIENFTQAANGTVSYNNDGTFTYTPNENFNGTDSFTYTVTDNNGSTDTATISVNVNSVNDGPMANDDIVTTNEDNAATTGNVLANDTDLDGDTLSIENFTQAANGTVSYNDDGTFTYTPNANYNGTDSFTYIVTDGKGSTDTATVTVNVNSINDGPVANDDVVSTNEDGTVTTGNVLANDTDLDGDTLTIDSFTQPEHGQVARNDNGTFTYWPDENFNGTDSFTYTITDGNGGTDTATVNINVESANDNPTATDDHIETLEDQSVVTTNILENDYDVDGDAIHLESFTQPAHGTVIDNGDGTFTYTPEANYNGEDSFTYTITDENGASETATVEVNVESVNDNPIAGDDSYTTQSGEEIKLTGLVSNDSDLDGDHLSINSFTKPAHGQLVYNDDGTFTYKPDEGFHGVDSFTYTISDGNGGTDTATVTINVTSADPQPQNIVEEDTPEPEDHSVQTDDDDNAPRPDFMPTANADSIHGYQDENDAVEHEQLAQSLAGLKTPEAPTISMDILEPQIQAVYEQVSDISDIVQETIEPLDSAEGHNFTDIRFDQLFEEITEESDTLDTNTDEEPTQLSKEAQRQAAELGDSQFIAGLWSMIRSAAGTNEDGKQKNEMRKKQ